MVLPPSKDYIQYKRLYTKDKKEKTHTLMPHSLKPISRKETTVQPTKATEGSSEKGDMHTQAKPTQSPRNGRSTANEGDRGGAKRGKTHTQAKKNRAKKTTVQPTKATEGDTIEPH